MKTITDRSDFLSGTITPKIQLTLRRTRLDFGNELYVKNDGAVIDSSNKQSDDYNDPAGTQGVVWGDSCVTDVTGYYVRVIAAAAWTSGGGTGMWRSKTTGSDWSLTSLTSPVALNGYARPGIYPIASSDNVYVWFVTSADNLVRYDLNTGTWAFSGATTNLALTAPDSCAVHPISADTAVVVAYTSPYLWAKVCTWSGSAWSSSSDWIILSGGDIGYEDAHWSDAAVSPSDSNKYVVAVNLSKWGSAHTVLYDSVSGLWSQPKEILPSAEQWGNLKVRVSGMEVINSRIWAVTCRQPVASGGVPMAAHVALVSSADGLNWGDEYFVTKSVLRGKLLYSASTDYCYAVGGTCVARAEASYRLGYDNTSLKYTLSEAWGLSASYSGVGAAPELTLLATNDSEGLSDSGLLESDNEITAEIEKSGGTLSLYASARLVTPERARQWQGDEITMRGYGLSSRILGQTGYSPIAAKNYQNPWWMYSNFNFSNGLARQTVRQVTGTWRTTGLGEYGKHVMHCSVAGIALLPSELQVQSFIMRMAFKAAVSIEGNFLVFWYEDEENYWRAGLYRSGSSHYLAIQQVVDGEVASKSSTGVTVAVDTWYTLYLDARPGSVRVYFNNTDSFDFSSATTTSYTTPVGAPARHHLGIECEAFTGFEGAVKNGTVDASGSNTLTDNSETFTSADLSRWVRCFGQDRIVSDYDTHVITVDPYWSSVPPAGEEWGLYEESSIDGPKMYIREIFACEARVPWTIDSITTNIMALAGVERSGVYTSPTIGTLSSSSPVLTDLDLKFTSALATTSMVFWCSTPTDTGTSAFTGRRTDVGSTTTRLRAIQGLNSGSSPYQTTESQDTQAIHPNMLTLPTASKIVRLQANREIIIVSCDGHFMTAFPVLLGNIGGFVARVTAGTCVTTEYPQMKDFIWDAADIAGSALARLHEGRRSKIVERADGSVAVSKFDSELGDLGTYTTPVVMLQTRDSGVSRAGIIEMVGAEERAFHLDVESARLKLNYVRVDNPTLDTQEQALAEAVRTAQLAKQKAVGASVGLYITDPAIELEDKFVVDGSGYRVEGFSFSIQRADDKTLGVSAMVKGRSVPTSLSTGVYGTMKYGGTTVYGG